MTLIAGCGRADAPSNDPPPTEPQIAQLPTEGECREFSNNLERAITTGDRASVDRLLGVLGIIDRCVDELGMTKTEKQQFLKGAARGLNFLPDQMIDEVKKGGKYSLLRIHQVDGRQRVLMRSIGPDGGVGYHDIILVKKPNGEVEIDDIYIYLGGEKLSQMLRHMILPVLTEKNQGLLAKLSGSERIYSKHIKTLAEMTIDNRNGKYKDALEKFRSLPVELQNNKYFQIIAMRAAQGLDDESGYVRELERYKKNFPNDPSLDLMIIDYYFIKNNHAEVFRALDRLDKAVGGDPQLWALTGSSLVKADRISEATALVEKAIKVEPNLTSAYQVRISISLKAKNHTDTLIWLKKGIETKALAADSDSLKMNPEYAEFIKTTAFEELKQWLAKR